MNDSLSHQIGEILYDRYRERIGVIIRKYDISSYPYHVTWADDKTFNGPMAYSFLEISRMKQQLLQYMEQQTVQATTA